MNNIAGKKVNNVIGNAIIVYVKPYNTGLLGMFMPVINPKLVKTMKIIRIKALNCLTLSFSITDFI